MEITPAETVEYLVSQARKAKVRDKNAAKAWIITAKTLYPNSFSIQFESYLLEKDENNFEEAAKIFSFIALTFQSHNAELWNEINELASALRAPEPDLTPAQSFYVNMFKYVAYDVQHKILLLTVNNAENSLNQCKLLLLILKRFPKAAVTHSPRLLEMIADGIKQDPKKYQELLVEEALPLIYHKTPELPPGLVCRVFTISLEYYIRQILEDEAKPEHNEIWRNIFDVLMLCAKFLRWEPFLPFNRYWGQNVYWEKLLQLVSKSPGSPQILFYSTTTFIYSLHCYIKNCHQRTDDAESNHVLVEAFSDWKMEHGDGQGKPPQISITTPTSQEISKAFVHAAQCWQLLNTEQFQRDFSNLLLALPLAPWISRFLFDLAMYFGHQEEAKKLMKEMTVKSSLVHNLQILSLNMLHGSLTLTGFECILKIIAELPATQGHTLDLTWNVPRHMIFIPLAQKPLVQYCTKVLVTNLSHKLYEPNCPDQVLGDLLVLLQLEYPWESLMAEQIFAIIASRRSFTYRNFSAYMVLAAFIEEFASIWNSHNEDFSFDFTPAQPESSSFNSRRLSTRGADKCTRDEFRLIVRQQIARCNESLTALIATFISQEHLQLMQDLFRPESSAL